MGNPGKNPAVLTLSLPLAILLPFLLFLIPSKSQADEICLSSGRLSNGLTYYIHHNPYSKEQISLDFIIKAGSLDEEEDERGLAHLIEHTLLHNLQFKDKKIADPRCEIWDFTSPSIGAMTSYAFTQYHFEISKEIQQGFKEALLGFSNSLTQFSLTEQDLQNMKDEALEEIEEIQLSPIESWKQWRIGQEYPPYQDRHPFGIQESISHASVEKIYQFYRKKYQPHRTAVIVIGNIDVQKTKNLIEKYFGQISATQDEETRKLPLKSLSEKPFVYINKGLKNTLISLTKPLPSISQRDSLTLAILTRLLSQHLRNCAENPQTAFAKPILETLTYPQMLRLTVSLPEDFDRGIDQLREELDSFFSQTITENQLDLIKADMKNNLKALQESGNDPFLVDFYRDHFIFNTSSLTTDHPYLRVFLLDTIHAEEINQMLQSFQGFSQASLGSSDEKIAFISQDLLSKQLLKNDVSWRSSYVD